MDKICRICLEHISLINSVNISENIFTKRTICDIIVECASIQLLVNDPLPQRLCLKCHEQLSTLNAFRQLIINSDGHLKKELLVLTEKASKQATNENIQIFIKEEQLIEKTKNVESFFNESSNESVHLESGINQDTSDEFIKEESYSNTQYKDRHFRDCNEQFQETKEISENRKREPLKPGRKPSNISKDNHKIHEFKCPICNKVLFGRSNRLKQHILMAHSDIKNHVCEVCDKKFKSKQQLVNHKRIHTGEKPYQCEFCQEKFTTPQNLFNHKKKHTGDYKNYKCDLCKKAYSTPGELETHTRITHTGERPFLCEICSKAYSSVRNLGVHIRSVHEKNEKCPKCDLMLSVKRLKQHLQQHKDREEGIRRYTCDKCGKGFFSSHALRKHQVIHTGEKPYSCEVCQKSFSQKFAVVTHMRVHSDVRSYSCEFCIKTFKYKQHLQLHTKKHHDDNTKSTFKPS